MKRSIMGGALAAFLIAAGPAGAGSNLLFVLDASGSMWGKIDDRHKITTAKTVLGGLIADLPADTRAGLMVYGHRKKSWCEDVELVAPVGGFSASRAGAVLDGITPRGKTPIAYSLSRAAAAFGDLDPDESKHVVLISDGIETCEGDPCAVAGALAEAGINVRVHVVGFDVSEADRRHLQCIADNGKGSYFSADSASGLADAVTEAVKIAAAPVRAPEPEPVAPPQDRTIFFDDFNGGSLADHWQVQNEDADSYLVEGGTLLAVSGDKAALEAGDVVNLFRLKQDLPKGDFVATMQFRMPYNTGREVPFFGIYEDKDNHTIAMANAWSYYEDIRGARLFLSSQKVSKGKKTAFNKVVWGGASGQRFNLASLPNPFFLRITRTGRSYLPSVGFNNGGETVWVDQEQITALRQKGQLAMGIFQADNVRGETPIHIDWVRIEQLQ